MEKEFVTYPLALRLKELGFDEPCFGYYDGNHNFNYMFEGKPENFSYRKFPLGHSVGWTSAPTYSQAFRWFREKYGFDCSFEDDIVEDDTNEEIQMWDFFIFKTKQKSDNKVMTFCSNNFDTYIESYSREEAELACLIKLIELVEQKK